MSFYLDASVVIPLFVSEDRSDTIERWLTAIEGDVHMADFAVAEFGATISRLVRMGRLSEAAASDIHIQFDLWRSEAVEPLQNAPADIRTAARLVRTPFPKLLTPDALHLATCKRLGLTLVTHDRRLLEIAERESVEAISPI